VSRRVNMRRSGGGGGGGAGDGNAFPSSPAPISEARQAAGVTVVTQFQAGHGWTLLGGTTGDLNATNASHTVGTQCAWFQGNGNNTSVGMRKTAGPSFDLTGKDVGLLLRVDEPNQILTGGGVSFILYAANSGFANFITFDMSSTASIKYFPRRSTSGTSFGGSWVYITIPIDPTATNAYTAKSGAQTAAQILAAVTDWQILHKDPAASTPAKISVQELFIIPKQATYPNGVCCLTFDDGYASCITKAAPMVQTASGRATAHLIKDQIGIANYLTLAQALQLQSTYQWAIGTHSYLGIDHEAGPGIGFTSLTADACTNDIQQERRWLRDQGFTAIDHLAYPHGAYCIEQDGSGNVNDRVDVTLAPYLKSARTLYGKMPETIPCADRMKLRVWVSTSNVTTLATLQTCADVCKRTQSAMIVVFHEIVDASATLSTQWLTADLQSFITYLGAQGIPLRTIDEVFV
jgi:peptidoglycan/xylan/chitin deacetylase (PgdA/CDA1 family)